MRKPRVKKTINNVGSRKKTCKINRGHIWKVIGLIWAWRTIEKYAYRPGRHIRKEMGLIWAKKDSRNRGEWNSIKTAIKELARGLAERESRYVIADDDSGRNRNVLH